MGAANSAEGAATSAPGAGWAAALQWLQDSAPAAAMREGRWLYPTVEAAHIIGFVILVGAAAMFDLRLLGLSRDRISVTDLARHVLPWSRGALLIIIPTGLLLFSSDAIATWGNSAFRIKMVLLGLALTNALVFRLWQQPRVSRWNAGTSTPPAAKLAAVLSLVLWTGVICCGRLIAYI